MNAIEIYENALYRVEHNITTLGEFEKEIEILKDVEPVNHGTWIPLNKREPQTWCCSKCATLGSPQWKRCPVCETKMDEVIS